MIGPKAMEALLSECIHGKENGIGCVPCQGTIEITERHAPKAGDLKATVVDESFVKRYDLLEKVVKAIEVKNYEGTVMLSVDHKDLPGGFGMRMDPNQMSGKIALEFGQLLDKVKKECGIINE